VKLQSKTKDRLRTALSDAVVSGSTASILSGAILSLFSKIEEGSAAGGLNGPSQWVWGEQAAYSREPSLAQTALGYGIHHSTSIFWATLYEYMYGRSRGDRIDRIPRAQIVLEAIGMAAGAYVVDYGLTPKRFQPGFEKHVSPVGMVGTYAAFAAGLALATLLRRRR
jgi:hypothetical protein